MKIVCEGKIIAMNVKNADSFFRRFKGLMGTKSLPEGEGLLLLNCPAVHCFFMKIPIDAVYLSEKMEVLGVESLRPWNVGRHIKSTAHVLELNVGTARVAVGDMLELQSC